MKRLAAALVLCIAASAAQKFVDMLADSGDFIKAGKYAEALKLDETVIAQMGEHYVSGDATAQLFAIAVAHKALALAGMGNEDEALWYWYAAASVYPAVARSDMSAFGAAGKFLAEHPPKPPEIRVPKDAQIVPATIVKKVETKYPTRTLQTLVETPVVVEFVVGRDGRAHAPRIVGDIPAPILAFATLEALHQWQFVPATANGQPVDAKYEMTFGFKVLH
ncbi:MAG TPA: energy transducer TonB [Thermoanaerobaculia bacterium]|nr:energy transducer TonB [Thermoanaerobaculia bacterium]